LTFLPLMVPADMFPQSTAVFSVYTTPSAKIRPERLWMCFLKQSHTYKYRAFRHPSRQKAHFRQAANHRKALYSSRFSGAYLFFTFCIKTTHSTCNERGGLMSFTLSVVGNKSKALFALSVGGNISTYIIITPTTRFVIGVIIIMTLVLLLTLLFLFLLLRLLF
jgi:hypothetical protein